MKPKYFFLQTFVFFLNSFNIDTLVCMSYGHLSISKGQVLSWLIQGKLNELSKKGMWLFVDVMHTSRSDQYSIECLALNNTFLLFMQETSRVMVCVKRQVEAWGEDKILNVQSLCLSFYNFVLI